MFAITVAVAVGEIAKIIRDSGVELVSGESNLVSTAFFGV